VVIILGGNLPFLIRIGGPIWPIRLARGLGGFTLPWLGFLGFLVGGGLGFSPNYFL